jgi:hypothetical protein
MSEAWKDIKGFEGLYQISNLGRVKSLKRNITFKDGRVCNKEEKIIKNRLSMGYFFVCLCKNSKSYPKKIHRLVAEAFIPNSENKPCIDHINGIRTDNRIENLRWVTYSENNMSPIYREKRKGLMKGHVFSKEHNNKISKANTNGKMSKQVVQIDLHGNVIKTWKSQAQVQRDTGFRQNKISLCCNHKKHRAYGYKWKFVDETMRQIQEESNADALEPAI